MEFSINIFSNFKKGVLNQKRFFLKLVNSNKFNFLSEDVITTRSFITSKNFILLNLKKYIFK